MTIDDLPNRQGYAVVRVGSQGHFAFELQRKSPARPRDQADHSDLMGDGDAVARSLVGHATTWQVPGVPEGASVLINPAAPDTSAILVRMRSRRPSSQMPPLGTVVRDQKAVDAITRWIATDLVRSH